MYLIKSMYLVRDQTHATSFFDPWQKIKLFTSNRLDRNQCFHVVKIFITIEAKIDSLHIFVCDFAFEFLRNITVSR